MTAFDSQIHHRRSIRLKGHDYSGGGLYFVTVCAHREFIQFAKGNPFGEGSVVGARPVSPSLGLAKAMQGATEGAMQGAMQGATQVSPVRGLIEERLRITAEKFPFMKWEEAVIMPDHLHALIRLQGGHARLGDVIGGFKAAVSREIRRMGETGVAPPKHIRIWHRNYYEMIVRTPKAERHIREYIRANPWKLVQHGAHEGQSYRMIGNPALLNREKTGMLCSRNCPPDVLAAARHRAYEAGEDCCFVSGFHSPPEKAILQSLLGGEARIICCPAWGIDTMKIPGDWLAPLDANRILIIEMRNGDGSVAAAEQRNRFVINFADKLWIPHVSRGGMLERLLGPVTSRSLPRLSSRLPASAYR